MTDKELKKLSRAELLEMMIEQSKEISSLKKKLDETEKQLKDRKIEIANSGSIAEAALKLNGVFEAAQKAADLYLENIRSQNDIYAAAESDAKEKVKQLLHETKLRCRAMEAETEKKCKDMIAAAQYLSNKDWNEVSEKLIRNLSEDAKLRELLAGSLPEQK